MMEISEYERISFAAVQLGLILMVGVSLFFYVSDSGYKYLKLWTTISSVLAVASLSLTIGIIIDYVDVEDGRGLGLTAFYIILTTFQIITLVFVWVFSCRLSTGSNFQRRERLDSKVEGLKNAF